MIFHRSFHDKSLQPLKSQLSPNIQIALKLHRNAVDFVGWKSKYFAKFLPKM
jgi:hypothetical protein